MTQAQKCCSSENERNERIFSQQNSEKYKSQ